MLSFTNICFDTKFLVWVYNRPNFIKVVPELLWPTQKNYCSTTISHDITTTMNSIAHMSGRSSKMNAIVIEAKTCAGQGEHDVSVKKEVCTKLNVPARLPLSWRRHQRHLLTKNKSAADKEKWLIESADKNKISW